MRHLCHDQVLRVRPGLQVLYEVFTLQIPESLSSVDSRNVTKDNVYKSVQSVMVKIDLLTSARVMTLLQVSRSLSRSLSLSLSLSLSRSHTRTTGLPRRPTWSGFAYVDDFEANGAEL